MRSTILRLQGLLALAAFFLASLSLVAEAAVRLP